MTLSNLLFVATFVALASSLSITNDGYWTAVGNMSVSRSDLGVSALGNAIIITGGCLGPQVSNVADNCSFSCNATTALVEAFFPANNSFVRLADMPRLRYRHSTEVINGLLYALGGRDSTDHLITAVDVYNYTTNTWTTSSFSYSDPSATSDFSTFVRNDLIWLVGGYDYYYNISSAVSTFSPTSGFTYNAITPMSDPRGDTCATVYGNTIYVVGGFDPASGANYTIPVSTLEIYDYNSGKWNYGPATPAPGGDKACGIINGRLHVFGGEGKQATNACVYSAPESNVEEFNLNTNTWTEEPPMDTPRFRFAAEYYTQPNGKQTLYVFGGQGPRNATGNFYPTLSSVEVWTDLYNTNSASSSSVTSASSTGNVSAASKMVAGLSALVLAFVIMF